MWRARGGGVLQLDGEHKAGSDSPHPVDTASLELDERVCGSPTREKTQRACSINPCVDGMVLVVSRR